MTTMFTDKLNLDKVTIRIDNDRLRDLEETLVNSTAFLAFVGAGDLAVEKIRAARVEFVTRSGAFDAKAFREWAEASIVAGVGALQAEVLTVPEQLKALPETAQEWPVKAQSLFADVVSTAFSTYGELAVRGKVVVTQVLGERPVVEDAEPVTRPATKKSATKKSATKKPAAKKPAAKKPAAKKKATAKTAAAETAAETAAAESVAAETAAVETPVVETAITPEETTTTSADTHS